MNLKTAGAKSSIRAIGSKIPPGRRASPGRIVRRAAGAATDGGDRSVCRRGNRGMKFPGRRRTARSARGPRRAERTAHLCATPDGEAMAGGRRGA